MKNILEINNNNNNNFWFSNGFDENRKNWIISNADKIRWEYSCYDTSNRWFKFLEKEHPEWDVSFIEGFYYPNGNYKNGIAHVWLDDSNGSIFDPTASQFDVS